MLTIIISDVHLGSRYCLCEQFRRFLGDIPAGADLVLNGDTVYRNGRDLTDEHNETLDLLRKESLNRHIVWVRGNHDKSYVLKDPGGIEFTSSCNIGNRLFVSHGNDFDFPWSLKRIFIVSFLFFYSLRMRFGAEPMHVAFYAKRFPRLYSVFRMQVSRKAVDYAKQHGYQAVTCGHTHYVEDQVINGIRYINTGAWTETPIFGLWVSDEEMVLKEIG